MKFMIRETKGAVAERGLKRRGNICLLQSQIELGEG
jgi:hypothetical protein